MPRRSRLLDPLPWYRWHPMQWQASRKAQRMSWAERGLYRELMDECWLKGSVSSTPEGIATLFDVELEEVTSLLPSVLRCFEIEDEVMRSPFVEAIRTDTDRFRLAQAKRRKINNKTEVPNTTTDHQLPPGTIPVNTGKPGPGVEKSREEKSREEKRKDNKKEISTELPLATPVPMTPLVMLSCAGTGTRSFAVTEAMVTGWAEAYPGLDVLQEVRKAKAWLDANPRNQKTSQGMPRFLVSWLNRAQDSPRPGNGPRASSPPPRRCAAAEAEHQAQTSQLAFPVLSHMEEP